MGLIKNAFFASGSVAMLMLQYSRTLFLPQVNSEKVDLIMHGMQDDFPFYH